MEKIRVLIIMGMYLPGSLSGGPITSVKNLVDCLYDKFDFYILTADRESRQSVPYNNINYDIWNQVGHAKVFYTKWGKFTLKLISRLAQETDIVYVCGCYNDYAVNAMILNKIRLLKKPLVIAPMGIFSEGALKIHFLKKIVFLKLFLMMGMFKKIIWSVTSLYELEDLDRIITHTDKVVYIAEDITGEVKNKCIYKKKEKGNCKVAWLSRITPKKNLLGTIEALSQVRTTIEFNIYGPVCDEKYWSRCVQALEKLPANIVWNYYGSVSSENVINVLERNHIFVLQTLGENYGHVIIEALSAGCPCIISDSTPWKSLEESGIGFVYSSNNLEGVAKAIEYYSDVDEDSFNTIASMCIGFAVNVSQENRESLGYTKLFESAVNGYDNAVKRCTGD